MSRIFAAIFLAAIAVSLAVGAFAPASWQDALATDGPSCPFRRVTGVDCPFCGMTRATIAIGRGDWHAAFGFHPLAPLVLAFLVVLLVIVIAGKTRVLLEGLRPYGLLATILAMWGLRFVV